MPDCCGLHKSSGTFQRQQPQWRMFEFKQRPTPVNCGLSELVASASPPWCSPQCLLLFMLGGAGFGFRSIYAQVDCENQTGCSGPCRCRWVFWSCKATSSFMEMAQSSNLLLCISALLKVMISSTVLMCFVKTIESQVFIVQTQVNPLLWCSHDVCSVFQSLVMLMSSRPQPFLLLLRFTWRTFYDSMVSSVPSLIPQTLWTKRSFRTLSNVTRLVFFCVVELDSGGLRCIVSLLCSYYVSVSLMLFDCFLWVMSY